jgi:hypothetical protein
VLAGTVGLEATAGWPALGGIMAGDPAEDANDDAGEDANDDGAEDDSGAGVATGGLWGIADWRRQSSSYAVRLAGSLRQAFAASISSKTRAHTAALGPGRNPRTRDCDRSAAAKIVSGSRSVGSTPSNWK